jgi:Flp pilus assembly protein TadG
VRRPFDPADRSGSTAVEFALIAPVMIMTLIGAFQLAWSLYCAATVRWSLETSARALMLTPTEPASTLKSAMLGQLTGLVKSADLAVTVTTDTSTGSKLLVAQSVYSGVLSVPFLPDKAISYTATTSVPTP